MKHLRIVMFLIPMVFATAGSAMAGSFWEETVIAVDNLGKYITTEKNPLKAIERNWIRRPRDKIARATMPVYGNWCGPNHPKDSTSKPVPLPWNAIDEACMRHDLKYAESISGEADRQLAKRLRDIAHKGYMWRYTEQPPAGRSDRNFEVIQDSKLTESEYYTALTIALYMDGQSTLTSVPDIFNGDFDATFYMVYPSAALNNLGLLGSVFGKEGGKAGDNLSQYIKTEKNPLKAIERNWIRRPRDEIARFGRKVFGW